MDPVEQIFFSQPYFFMYNKNFFVVNFVFNICIVSAVIFLVCVNKIFHKNLVVSDNLIRKLALCDLPHVLHEQIKNSQRLDSSYRKALSTKEIIDSLSAKVKRFNLHDSKTSPPAANVKKIQISKRGYVSTKFCSKLTNQKDITTVSNDYTVATSNSKDRQKHIKTKLFKGEVEEDSSRNCSRGGKTFRNRSKIVNRHRPNIVQNEIDISLPPIITRSLNNSNDKFDDKIETRLEIKRERDLTKKKETLHVKIPLVTVLCDSEDAEENQRPFPNDGIVPRERRKKRKTRDELNRNHK